MGTLASKMAAEKDKFIDGKGRRCQTLVTCKPDRRLALRRFSHPRQGDVRRVFTVFRFQPAQDQGPFNLTLKMAQGWPTRHRGPDRVNHMAAAEGFDTRQ